MTNDQIRCAHHPPGPRGHIAEPWTYRHGCDVFPNTMANRHLTVAMRVILRETYFGSANVSRHNQKLRQTGGPVSVHMDRVCPLHFAFSILHWPACFSVVSLTHASQGYRRQADTHGTAG